MGPTALFDKSFLQSLSLDESLWFDHFFIANICPLFYVETLADLEKSVRAGRTPEQEVGIIADKTPDMHGMPCALHLELCIGNLLGQRVPMTYQIPVAGARVVKVDGKRSVVYDETPESKAFSRWQKRSFLEVERTFAKGWRANLKQLDLAALADDFRALGISGKTCQTLQDAKALADQIVGGHDQLFDRMKLAVSTLKLPERLHRPIMEHWASRGRPPLTEFAQYAAHVVTVELFFQIALAANLIATERASNQVDIAYLCYLPFCGVFASFDRLHERCAHLFLRDDQDFVWGPDLKAELARVNTHFSALPQDIKEKGMSAFAHYPPGSDQDLIVRLWDRHLPNWRPILRRDGIREPTKDVALAEEIRRMTDAPSLSLEDIDFDPQETDALTIQRFLPKRKGNWYLLPKDLESDLGS